jgi:hypothetical protein
LSSLEEEHLTNASPWNIHQDELILGDPPVNNENDLDIKLDDKCNSPPSHVSKLNTGFCFKSHNCMNLDFPLLFLLPGEVEKSLLSVKPSDFCHAT